MYRVLIADDDILMREALHVMIAKDSAFKVVSMTDTGERAVRVCKEDVIDIVFMDMQMPGITGLEASRLFTSPIRRLVYISFLPMPPTF